MTERLTTTGILSSEIPVAPHEDRVLLFGELLADCFPDGDRIGGAPFNVARHLRAFGAKPLLVSRTGQDDLGGRLQQLLSQWCMDQTGIQRDAMHPTGRVRVHTSGSGHHFEILPDQAYDHIEAQDVRRVAEAVTPALLYFGTLIQRQPSSRQALKTLLQTSAAPRFLDLNLRPPWYDTAIVEDSLRAADVLKLNQEELASVAALLELAHDSPGRLVSELMHRFSVRLVLVTAGGEGAWLTDADGQEVRVQGQAPPRLIDSVGAGDAFSAVFILGLLKHWPAALALQRADNFARAICGIRGAVPLDDSFYGPFLADWDIIPGDPRC